MPPKVNDKLARVAQTRVNKQEENSKKKVKNELEEIVNTKKPKKGNVTSKKKSKV